jgi:hypothetical protein
MADLERQEAVEQAADGCLVAVALLAVGTVGVVALAWSSVATPILAGLLILGGLGLAVVHWAAKP